MENKTAQNAQAAYEQLKKGEKTLNQIREEFSLGPIDGGDALISPKELGFGYVAERRGRLIENEDIYIY